jgi:predicted metalloprotease
LPSPIRPRLAAAAAMMLVVGGAGYGLAAAHAHDPTTPRDNLVLTSQDGAKPATMAQFLTSVTKDVDAYWAKTFAASGLPEPKVSYRWIPAGQSVASACGDEDGRLGDSAAAYCANDDTIYISEKFATDIYDGALDQALPGSAQGYGGTVGDFSVAYIVAHEFGHEIQDELGLFDKYRGSVPTMAFELQADCYAGTWAKSAYDENRLEDGDVQEALDAALAVGDFDTDNPGHHGTPEQREEAWSAGFDSGDPSSCAGYLDPAAVT